ncbi:MAG TPA: TIGR01777 family oxidoreductase [Tepidisphaeraceae bacterium]|nr:TIGR01777 family oxidoreductase [Tepidisphaeraceae bacterium]
MTGTTPTRPRVVIAGGSGFLGAGLIPDLLAAGYDAVVLTRGGAASSQDGRVRYVTWDARTAGDWASELDGAAAIVNLVGRTVDCRKTPANKRVILESRVDSVRALAAAWARAANPPKVWVQSATAHIFGDTWDEVLDDASPTGTGFAPQVGRAWEAALAAADLPGVRKVVLRISFVLGRNGGALKTLAKLTRWFMGGPTGSGRQYMSWLHQADLNAIILRALADESMSGAYVTTAPGPVTNREFMRTLRRVLRRPWTPRVPSPLVRVGAWFMRTDPELALYGRRLAPTRLLSEGYAFRFPELERALRDLL